MDIFLSDFSGQASHDDVSLGVAKAVIFVQGLVFNFDCKTNLTALEQSILHGSEAV